MATFGKPWRVGAGCWRSGVGSVGMAGLAHGEVVDDVVVAAAGFGEVDVLEEGTVVSFVDRSLEPDCTGAVTAAGRTVIPSQLGGTRTHTDPSFSKLTELGRSRDWARGL